MNTETSRAFNRGSDARLMGLSRACNPHHGWREASLHASWNSGWSDADQWWGKWVRGRWPVKRLPQVA